MIAARRTRLSAALIALGLVLGARRTEAQSRAFVFSVTTIRPSPADAWTLQYDAGFGEQTVQALAEKGVDQRVSVQGALGAGFTVRGQFGLAIESEAGARSSQEAELLKDILSRPGGLSLAVGVGVRREWDGTTTWLGRIVVGRAFTPSWLYGNLRVEKSFAAGRDEVDLIATAGWLYRVGPALHVGVEAVAQDLEGFWEPEEAEGGARVFAGPSLHYSRPGGPFYASLCGGPVFLASNSHGTSDVPRPLGRSGSGYTVRLSVGYAF